MRVRTAMRGFTLIELLITTAVFAILVALAGPSVANYLQNTQIRNAAESILNGLRTAQTMAVKRNGNVEFIVTSGSGWKVRETDGGTVVEQYDWKAGAKNATIAITPAGADTVTFNGLGRVAANADASASMTQIDIDNPSASMPRPLRVVFDTLTPLKMCDPNLPSTDSKACP